MVEAIKLFLGEHDFTSFCSADVDDRKAVLKQLQRLI